MTLQTQKPRNVSDIIDITYLQQIQDGLGRVLGITTALIDQQGYPITQATNLHAFCAMMQASEKGLPMCLRTNMQLIAINREKREPAVLPCPNSGLMTAAVPIFLRDEYLGSWLIGQLRTNDVDMALIERTAQAAGLSLQEAKANVAALPIISQGKFENILEFLRVITRSLISMVETNDTLQNTNAELVELTQRLNASAQTFNDFINLTDVGVYVCDYNTGELLMYNNIYGSLSGRTPDELKHMKCYEVMGNARVCEQCPRDMLLDDEGEPREAVVWETTLEKYAMWLRVTSRAIRWMDGRLAIMVTFFDITDQKEREKEMSFLAYYDQRLQIPNGMRLLQDINETVAEKPHLICFDIQALRRINDAYGRETGDALLRAIRDWVTRDGGQGNQLYRLEGDEFVLLAKVGELPAAMELAQSIYNRFDEAWRVGEDTMQHRIFARVSMGVITCGLEMAQDDYSGLHNMVERILAAARNHAAPLHYDADIDQEYQRHLQLELSLKACVLNNMQGFSLNYQPLVDPHAGEWIGMEALCRWNSPDLGRVPPDVFIHEAEQLGLIDVVGEWVLNEALGQVKRWGLDACEGFMLDVNLSPLQLSDRELHHKVKGALARHDYPPENLSLEITESAEVHDDQNIRNTLSALRKLGVTLSLDDFGSGYASFASLNTLPIAIIKTDRSFVLNIEQDAFLRDTFRVMVDFAHAAGKLVIAEGVETQEQLDILTNLGVDLIQGYFYSRPLDAQGMTPQAGRFTSACG